MPTNHKFKKRKGFYEKKVFRKFLKIKKKCLKNGVNIRHEKRYKIYCCGSIANEDWNILNETNNILGQQYIYIYI